MAMQQMLGLISGSSDFQIDRSLRFNSADSAYLNRTPSSAGNRKTWTWSGWVKRAEDNSVNQSLWSIRNGAPNQQLFRIESTNLLRIYLEVSSSVKYDLSTSQVFRDFSAWYHIVLVFDSTESTASDRVKLYVNGAQVTDFASATYPSLNQDGVINTSGAEHDIGQGGNNNDYLGGYLADVHFIDGQALTSSSFGEYDDNNVWQPKAYAGTYGTNGFHLDFSDNSSNSALGNDSSGNNNDWTVNNFLALAVRQVSRDSTKITFNNLQSGSAAALVDGTLSYTDTNFSPANAGYVDYNISSYGFSVGDVIGVRYWNAAHAAGQTITATFDQRDSSGNQISGTVAATQTWTQGQKYNDNTGYVLHTLATNFNSLRVTLSNNSSSNPWGIGEIEFAPAGDTDSLIDTPTDYDADSGNNGGNYATLNPLQKSSGSTLSNGNLDISMSGAQGTTFATMAFPASGKWYFECTSNATECDIGIAKADASLSQYLGKNSSGYGYYKNGTVYNNDASAGSGASYASGDIIGVAFDADAGTCKWYKNNALQVTVSSLSGEWFPAFGAGSAAGIFNFGSRPFAYTPPSNHLPLVTTNLTDPTIEDPSTAMDVTLYNGNGGTAQTISGINHSPDFVWYKHRSAASSHGLFDIVRGANNYLSSNSTSAEQTVSGVTAFNSDGFSLGTDTGANGSGTWVAWTWDGGSTTATNNNGSIQSTVRANQSAGFSIVTWSGSSANATIGHGLNAAPEFMILKRRDSGSLGMYAYHSAVSPAKTLYLYGTTYAETYAAAYNNTAPTNSVFSVGSAAATNSGNMLAYCFAPVAGYSAFGSYTGNGSSDGTFVYTGFRVAWLMTKRTDTAENWEVRDSTRNPHNRTNLTLFPHTSGAEDSGSVDFDLLSNGFKLRNTNGSTNASGGTYIYMAFAESPFKTARAR